MLSGCCHTHPCSRAQGVAPSSIKVLLTGEDEHLADVAELSHRVPLGRGSLPSACCFTVHSEGTGLVNSVEMARDASLVAAAFDDSTLRVWDLWVHCLPGFPVCATRGPGAHPRRARARAAQQTRTRWI
jgi:hypothetical protein